MTDKILCATIGLTFWAAVLALIVQAWPNALIGVRVLAHSFGL